MLKRFALLTVCSVFAVGCAFEVEEGDDLSEEPIAEAESAVVLENAITMNAITMNAITMNAITMNALTPSTLPASSMSLLRDMTVTGTLARMYVKYLVSCALNNTQSFSFAWTDDQGIEHDETFFGAIAIAPGWAGRGLTELEQRWVSACIAARVNYYGIPVSLSLRGEHPSLAADAAERSQWSHKEGAFWGNLFAPTPYIFSCHNPTEVDHARAKLRDCAAGHWDGMDATSCGSLGRQGSCDELCAAVEDPTDGYTACAGASEVVTSFLMD